MLICKECKNVYVKSSIRDREWCPRVDCNGALAEIDDALAPIIRKMWQNNVSTKYSCAGHPATFDSCGETYIVFDLEQSGIIIHEKLKLLMKTTYSDILAPEIIVEYMPVLNKYQIRLPYGGYMNWLYNLKFFSELALVSDPGHAASETMPNANIDIHDYFYNEFINIDSCEYMDSVEFRIGALSQIGPIWNDETEYWNVTQNSCFTMHWEEDEVGNRKPHEMYPINDEIDFETFKKFDETIKSSDELLSIVRAKT